MAGGAVKWRLGLGIVAVCVTVSPGNAKQVSDRPIAVPPESPKGWKEIPRMADRARAAAETQGGPDSVVAARAWGDRSGGAFALYLSVRAGTGGDREMHEALRNALQAGDREITGWDYSDGVSRHRFAQGQFRGMTAVRTESRSDMKVAASLTCFHNERQPRDSAAACDEMLTKFAAH